MGLAENVPRAKQQLAILVRVRDLLSCKVHGIWARHLMEADSQVTGTAGDAILGKCVELGHLVHCAVMVNADAAHNELVRSIKSLIVTSECWLFVNRMRQLTNTIIVELN